MNKEDQINLEILSKIVIGLKTSQFEITKKFSEDIENIKSENASNLMSLRQKYDSEIMTMKEELHEIKQKLFNSEKNYINEINEMKGKFEKSSFELREDMLKLLRKYEDKFQTQDDEIEVLKSKCEMADCKVCNFQSFKVHFLQCEECENFTCSNCLGVCLKCRKARCIECLINCNSCVEKLCKDCLIKCNNCSKKTCNDCFSECLYCNKKICKKCLMMCRKCEKSACTECSASCEKCNESVSCKNCFNIDSENEKCVCGKLYCFNCEDECMDCTIPCLWENENRIFTGFHTKSISSLPTNCLVKFYIINKGIDTSHIGLTSDSKLVMEERATENFWSVCLNSGEKFSTTDYKKKGVPWTKYAMPIKTGDTLYLKFLNGEVRFLINRKEFPIAFNLDKNLKYFLYCLTHNDSTQIEIKSLKIYK